MKLAICISGGFRNCTELYPNFKKYILDNDAYEADVFFSSWDSRIPHFKVNIPDEAVLHTVLDLYKPKAYSYEIYNQEKRRELYNWTRMNEFQQFARRNKSIVRTHGRWKKHDICNICGQKGYIGQKCRICGGDNVHNQIGMLYNIQKAYQEAYIYSIMECEDYDLYLRTRFDNVYFEKISPEMLAAAKTSWVIPEGDDDLPDYGGGCNDQFCLSSPGLMLKYSQIYDNIKDFAMLNYNTKGGYGIPHMSINNMADREGIKITRLPFKYALHKRLEERK
jgi:hypothetical protein